MIEKQLLYRTNNLNLKSHSVLGLKLQNTLCMLICFSSIQQYVSHVQNTKKKKLFNHICCTYLYVFWTCIKIHSLKFQTLSIKNAKRYLKPHVFGYVKLVGLHYNGYAFLHGIYKINTHTNTESHFNCCNRFKFKFQLRARQKVYIAMTKPHLFVERF